jgi:RHS repeat-associated protein
MRYDAGGNLIWHCDPLGNITKSKYDKFGRLIETILPNSGLTKYDYNSAGEVISVIDPMGRATQFEYDSMGRRVKTILPRPDETSDNPVQETVYNEIGLVEFQIDPLDHASRFEYDEQGRVVRQTDANGSVTLFSYNEEGKLLSLTDPAGNTTCYEYDEFDRVIKETNELGKSRIFEYLPSGLLAEKTDRNKRTTCFKYNRFGQILEEHWLDDKRTINQICFEYDKAGHLTKVNDTNSSFEYGYDSLGRQNSETITIDGLNENILLRNTFDVMGHRIAQTAFVGHHEDYTNHWTYNSLGQVTKISQKRLSDFPKTVEYSYNLSRQRTGIKAGNVYQLSLSYDGMGQLAGIDYKNPVGETLAKYGLTWDIAGRIVAMNLNGEPAQYGYDVTNQLVSATYKNLPSESYQYDANGNRKNFVIGKNNQLTNDGVFKYTYDSEGNRITKISKKSRTEYFWDHRNRLVKVIADGKIVEYIYDYQNRLMKRNDDFFVHNDWQIVLTLDSKGKIKEHFLWGARQDELLCENDHWTLCDHLGTVREIIDESGKTVSHIDYSAFGESLNVSGIKPRFCYTGKMFDDVTQLQWNVNRWYDPKVGRWISEAPINFLGRDINLVRYILNQPLWAIDLLGYIGKTIKKLYADGTCSGGCVDWIGQGSGPFQNSNVKRFYEKVLSDAKGHVCTNGYCEGPKFARDGSDALEIMSKVYEKICEDTFAAKDKCDKLEIYLLGWSRGSTIVVQVAKRLGARCSRIKENGNGLDYIEGPVIKWVGLFDAVNQTNFSNWGDLALPNNIEKASHAKKTSQHYLYNIIFWTMNYTGNINNKSFTKSNGVNTTHSDIGNGWLDQSGNWNNDVLNWMISEAKLNGLPFIK